MTYLEAFVKNPDYIDGHLNNIKNSQTIYAFVNIGAKRKQMAL